MPQWLPPAVRLPKDGACESSKSRRGAVLRRARRLRGRGNFIDTADSYTVTWPGNQSGDPENIIGRWLAARGNRDQMVIATKVMEHP